jgi:transposase
MNSHKNAPLTPKGREAMVRSVTEGGSSKAAAARQFNTMPKTVAKWVGRFRADGVDGLRDRSSRPHSLPSQTPVTTCTAIETLRRQRHTGNHIAAEVGVSAATVSRILRRLGLNRLSALEPAEPIRRYQREIHVLPSGFHRIRYYGFLGNCHRVRKLDRCRVLLGMAAVAPTDPPADYRDRFEALTGRSLRNARAATPASRW